MVQFGILAVLLIAVAIGFVWLPIVRYRRQIKTIQREPAVSSRAVNLQAYRSRLQELEEELSQGRVEQAEYEGLKLELERALLTDATDETGGAAQTSDRQHRQAFSGRVLGGLLSVAVLVGTVALYWQLGSGPTLLQMEQHQQMLEEMASMTPEQRLEVLRKQAEAEPDRPEIWYALAQGYLQTGKYGQGRRAYDRVLSLVGEDIQVLSEYAQSLFFINKNSMDEEIRGLVERVLAVDPNNDVALGLLGIDAFDREQYGQAITYWQQIVDTMEPGAEISAIKAGIARARELMGEPKDGASQEQSSGSLLIRVSLSEELEQRTSPDQTVFVYARALQGPAMPLAAVKLKVADLPAEVVLNDRMAMTPQARLSQFDQVQVIARISHNQSVSAGSGDLQGESDPINPLKAATNVHILIDNIVE